MKYSKFIYLYFLLFSIKTTAQTEKIPFTQNLTIRAELVHRHANIPYFAGKGGVTSPSGYTTTTLDNTWRPDLVKTENRVILALLFRL